MSFAFASERYTPRGPRFNASEDVRQNPGRADNNQNPQAERGSWYLHGKTDGGALMSEELRTTISDLRKTADAIYEIADRQKDEKLRALARDIYLGLRKIKVRL